MLIHSASQLLTLQGGPQRGRDLGRLGLIEDGAILVRDENILEVGPSNELIKAYPDEARLDASGCVVLPGFVDPHTHVVWAGERAAEFERKMAGATYLEILAAGGGILSTVRKTRLASSETLIDETRLRLQRMFAHGTTTAEAKTGYGLETTSELRLLAALLQLDGEGPLELAPTFLGAHAIPPEYQGDPQGYTDHLCNEMLPAVLQWWRQQPSTGAGARPLPFVDVFCETGAFDLAQSRQILTKAKELGFPLKIHADEFDNLGGASLAASLGAASADHLVKTSAADIAVLAGSDSVAVSLPCTPFGLAENAYTPAHTILDANGFLALATDCNPGTAWCEFHAVRHRPGLPRPEIDSCPGYRGCHHQCRPRHPPRLPDRFARTRQAGRSIGPVGSGLSPARLSLRDQPGQTGNQAWKSLSCGQRVSAGIGV